MSFLTGVRRSRFCSSASRSLRGPSHGPCLHRAPRPQGSAARDAKPEDRFCFPRSIRLAPESAASQAFVRLQDGASRHERRWPSRSSSLQRQTDRRRPTPKRPVGLSPSSVESAMRTASPRVSPQPIAERALNQWGKNDAQSVEGADCSSGMRGGPGTILKNVLLCTHESRWRSFAFRRGQTRKLSAPPRR